MAINKVINSQSQEFQPVLTDTLVLDAVPTVNSFNSVTSDAVARAVAGASGEVPQVTESDNGKVLTAVYDEGGPAVEWAEAQGGGSVTTVDKAFTVGVNGTGLPITVDCANATSVGNSTSFTENGSYTTLGNYPAVVFPLSHLDPCTLGSGTATLTIPEDITYDTTGMALNSVQISYWNGSSPGPSCSISSSFLSTGKINAGTYTISGANSATSYFSDGIIIFIAGSGNPTPWNNFIAAFTEAVQSWTISYSAIEVTGYSITPTVLPSVTGNAGKFLTVTGSILAWGSVPNELPPLTGNANSVLTVNRGANDVVWTAPLDYTMVYATTPAGGSMTEEPWQAVQNRKRIGCLVPYAAFSGSLAAGSLYNAGWIYLPLASVVDRGSGEYKWNFYLYDGANKWSLVLTCEEDEWSWGTPSVVPG